MIEGFKGKFVVEIACGNAYNLCSTADGSVYSWGIGESGQLGRKVAEMKNGEGEEATYDNNTILRN